MSKQQDADLILKLYDLRREARMREARNWLFTFNPTSVQDIMDVLTGRAQRPLSHGDFLLGHGCVDGQQRRHR